MVDFDYDPGEYSRFAVTVDVAVFTIRDDRLQVLLIERGGAPFLGAWALPGGFVRPGEDLDQAAARELAEETGLRKGSWHLEQLASYGAPDRDPRMRVVTVAYWAICADLPALRAGGDAAAATLIPVEEVESGRVRLAFDHERIVKDAVERARSKLEYTALAAKFCPPQFTIGQLRRVCEVVWGGTRLDPGNFQRNVEQSGAFEQAVQHGRSDERRRQRDVEQSGAGEEPEEAVAESGFRRGRPASLWTVVDPPGAPLKRMLATRTPRRRRPSRRATGGPASTTRDAYLRDPCVAAFIEWLRPRVRGDEPFPHAYRMPAGDWRCGSLWEAYTNYRWRGAGFDANQERLDRLATDIRRAVQDDDRRGFVTAAECVLRWGGVAGGNARRLRALGDEALATFRDASRRLDPCRADTSRLDGVLMNSGWTKVYALLLDDFPMYDGRVGAAMGYLVRRYCVFEQIAAVPEPLRFRWLTGKGRANRDPSMGSLRFPMLTAANPRAWAACNVRAAWVLSAVRGEGRFGDLDLRRGLRALGAALFMIGYELPRHG